VKSFGPVHRRYRQTSLLMLALLAILVPVQSASAQQLNEAAWKPGAQWLSLRFGYAKAQGQFDPNGNVGWGFGYSQMVSKRLSLGANFQQDLLGKFNGSALLEYPLAIETLWHFKLRTAMRPYAGIGMGAYYRKTYRTGADHSEFEPAYMASVGTNVAIDGSHLLGLDIRLAGVGNDQVGENPVFGVEKDRTVHWSVKLNYALTY
jgi:outer membrane protein W